MAKTTTEYWLAIRFIPRLASHKKIELAARYSFKTLFSAEFDFSKVNLSDKQIQAIKNPDWSRVDAIISACKKHQIQLIDFDDKKYPPLLKQIYDPPLVLYAKGKPGLLKAGQLAFVGSRFATIQGLETAKLLAKQCIESSGVVTSGLAIGIDGAAHQGALSANGKTIAVVATGLDRVYPARHKQLAQNILNSGGLIISENPPGTPAKAGLFPKRNRIISGLSKGVVVVEAAVKSGSLITARSALEQNREVFAVPGSINNSQVKGCHFLIKQGAKLVEDFADIKEELAFDENSGLYLKHHPVIEGTDVTKKQQKNLNQDLFLDPLLASVGYETTPVDKVVSRTKLPTDVVITRLTMLELRGLVTAVPGGYLRMNRG